MAAPRQPQNILRFAGLTTQWLVMLGVAVWGGLKLDHLLKWEVPVCTIVLPLVALGISLWQLIKELNRSKE